MCGDCGGCGAYMKSLHFVVIRQEILQYTLYNIQKITMCGDCCGCGAYMKSLHFVVIRQEILCISN